MRKVEFASRAEAQRRQGDQSWAVISIGDPKTAHAKLQDGWHGVLFIDFHDAEKPPIDKQAFVVMFDQKHAQQIAKFVSRVAPEVQGIMVHCFSGISRSPAVAKWICEEYSLDVASPTHFNQHIYETLKNYRTKILKE